MESSRKAFYRSDKLNIVVEDSAKEFLRALKRGLGKTEKEFQKTIGVREIVIGERTLIEAVV